MDIALALTVLGWVVSAAAGAIATRMFERRPRLLSFFLASSAITTPGPNPATVHTHAIVIRNAGGSPANNVRVSHAVMPAAFSVFPSVPYQVEALPDGTQQILFAKLAPKTQLTINYLYFPPLTWNQIHTGIMSDEGHARQIFVLPSPRLPLWGLIGLWFLLAVGASTLLYLAALVALQFMGR